MSACISPSEQALRQQLLALSEAGLPLAEQQEIGRALQTGCANSASPLDFRLHHVGLLRTGARGQRHAAYRSATQQGGASCNHGFGIHR